MDAERFDTLTRALLRGGTRRAAVSSLLAGSLSLLTLAETVARKTRRAEGTKQGDATAEACIPTGKRCPSPKSRGKRGKNRKQAAHLSCSQCCQRRTAQDAQGYTVCSCAPDNTPCTENSDCCLGVCNGEVCGSGAIVPLPTGPVILPPRCNFPLRRDLAPQGSGMAGTNQCAVAGGCQQTVQVSLQGAPPNTGYDVYIDQESAGNQAHTFAGTFITDGNGNAFFQNTITIPRACPSTVDNELVFAGMPYEKLGEHQFIQESFTPCPFC